MSAFRHTSRLTCDFVGGCTSAERCGARRSGERGYRATAQRKVRSTVRVGPRFPAMADCTANYSVDSLFAQVQEVAATPRCFGGR